MRTMFGLHWVRTRQRDLTRAVLALFCLSWLQAAAMPCVMASDLLPASHHECQYCPPSSASTDGFAHDDACVYPHAPQVDARAASGLFFALPVTAVIATLVAQPAASVGVVGRVDPGVPRTPLAVSYCRLIL